MPDWNKPLPTIAGETKPFWDACRRGTLLIQQCGQCNQYQFLPQGHLLQLLVRRHQLGNRQRQGHSLDLHRDSPEWNPRFRPGGPLRAGPGGVG